ncbi:SulP family inorganic anion transporter, partial [Acinetobacter baumannii]
RIGLPRLGALAITRAMPLLLVIIPSVLVATLDLGHAGLPLVGKVQQGLPGVSLPRFDAVPWRRLLGPGALLGLVAYLEGISVA